jgi:hypothetical protein
MPTVSDREIRRKGFEALGVETLRLRVTNPWVTLDDKYRREAEAWLREQDVVTEAREKKRYRTILGWTIAAAVASIIAAVTGIITVTH